jgi:hypothetical protein
MCNNPFIIFSYISEMAHPTFFNGAPYYHLGIIFVSGIVSFLFIFVSFLIYKFFTKKSGKSYVWIIMYFIIQYLLLTFILNLISSCSTDF